MQNTYFTSFCNSNIEVRYEFLPGSPMTFILSGGYGSFNLDEPVQVEFIKLLANHNISWVQYLYPERNPHNSFSDLYVSTGILALSEVHRWVKRQVDSSIGLFGISFGAMISIEFALMEQLKTLILINTVFDYVDYRSKQIGKEAMIAWKQNMFTCLPYGYRQLPLGYRFVQETERQNLEERARNIKCRAYAFQGDKDPAITPQHIIRLEKENENWHSFIINGADHGFSEKFAIGSFLDKIEPIIKSLSGRMMD